MQTSRKIQKISITDFQAVTKKVLKNNKKIFKKRYNVLKNSVPLHRFNKQLIVLQVLKKAKK